MKTKPKTGDVHRGTQALDSVDSQSADSRGNGCWNCKHETEDVQYKTCAGCDWFDNWESPNAEHKTGVATDSLNSLVMQLTEKASKGLATCRSGDGNPKVVIEFRNLRECQEFYKALVTLWGGYYEIPNEQSALSKTKLEPINQRTER